LVPNSAGNSTPEVTGEVANIDYEDLIEEENNVVTLSHNGYIQAPWPPRLDGLRRQPDFGMTSEPTKAISGPALRRHLRRPAGPAVR
jgi:hypothetical protein